MAEKHLYLGNEFAKVINFTPKNNGGDSKSLPERNAREHSTLLRERYADSIAAAEGMIRSREDANMPTASGVYLDVDLKGGKPFDRLDASGAHLMSVGQPQNDVITATIFLPLDKKEWLNQKLDKYDSTIADNGNRAHQALVNAIEDVKQSKARSLFPQKEEYDGLQAGAERLFELWVDEIDSEKLGEIRQKMDAMGLAIQGDNIITFESVTVFLVRAIKEVIDDIPCSLDVVEAIKLYHNPARMMNTNEDQRDWAQLIKDYVAVALGENPVIVGLLDKGVNNGHELIEPFLPDERRASVLEGVGVGHEGFHGTCMAGMIEYGDLSKYQLGEGPEVVHHALASVKLLSDIHDNEPALYGLLTKRAIEQSVSFGGNIICMALTEDEERNDGTQTSWSAAIDSALYDGGACDRLMLISAGNTDYNIVDEQNYLDTLAVSSMQSPSQAMNAIAVGAYTEFAVCEREGWTPIAPPQGMSPMTRTTVMWRGKNSKPDIVMEGGNAAHHRLVNVDHKGFNDSLCRMDRRDDSFGRHFNKNHGILWIWRAKGRKSYGEREYKCNLHLRE